MRTTLTHPSETAAASPAETAERPWLDRYPICVPQTLDYPAIPAWALLARTADSHPDRIACCYYKQRLTYADLEQSARRTAAMLVRFGVQPGDRVGILLPNVPEYISALNGIWMAGAVAVAISPLMVPKEVSGLMQTANCRIVIGLDLLAPLIEQGGYVPKHVVYTTLKDRLPGWQRLGYAFAKLKRLGFRPPADGPSRHSYDEELAGSDAGFEPVELPSLDEPAYLLATGGTTGSPKIVTLSHRNLVANAWQVFHWAGARIARDKILAVLPFFHSYGLSSCLLAGTAMAATLVMHHRFVPRIVLRLIEEHRPTAFPTVPAMLAALNDLLRCKPADLSSLQYCVSGGAPLDSAIADEFATHCRAQIVEGFGLSEAGPVTHTGPLDGNNRPGTIGLPMPDTDARIVDADTGGREMPPGEIGELIVRGPQVMLGYWNDPSATGEVVRGGWLFTGDLGMRDEDGFFRIVDRKKDLIITSGFNVYPTDVEHVLREFAAVRDVAVIGVPDGGRGQPVKAMLVLEDGFAFDQQAFDAFCREHLSKQKRPRIVEIVEGDLPRNFLGKVLRRHLRTPGIK